jgi:hypothetical protein
METTHKQSHLGKWILVQWKITDIPTGLFESLFCLATLLNFVVVGNFEVMLGQTLNHSVENYNYIKCYIFVNYLNRC